MPESESEVDKTFALMHPDGRLEWKPLSAKDEVDKLVGGYHGPHVIATGWLGLAGTNREGTGAMRLIASNLCLTEHYEPNPHAKRVITEMSVGYLTQRWGGVVALCEYERDPVTGEVYFPQPMSSARITQISAFFDKP